MLSGISPWPLFNMKWSTSALLSGIVQQAGIYGYFRAKATLGLLSGGQCSISTKRPPSPGARREHGQVQVPAPLQRSQEVLSPCPLVSHPPMLLLSRQAIARRPRRPAGNNYGDRFQI